MGKNNKGGNLFNPSMGSKTGQEDGNNQGVTLNAVIDVLKVLDMSPQILSKSELQSLFI